MMLEFSGCRCRPLYVNVKDGAAAQARIAAWAAALSASGLSGGMGVSRSSMLYPPSSTEVILPYRVCATTVPVAGGQGGVGSTMGRHRARAPVPPVNAAAA